MLCAHPARSKRAVFAENDFDFEVLLCQLEGFIVRNDAIQYSPEVVSYPCTSCLRPAFNDA